MVITFSIQVRIVQTWACWNANSMNRVKKLFDYKITWDGKEVLIYLFSPYLFIYLFLSKGEVLLTGKNMQEEVLNFCLNVKYC